MNRQLQQAKTHFSEVVKRARESGPRTVTVRGRRAVVALSVDDCDALTVDRPSWVEHLLSGPAWDGELAETVNARAKAPSRDFEDAPVKVVNPFG